MSQDLNTNISNQQDAENNNEFAKLEAEQSGNINIPEGYSVANADISRDGQDLVLNFSDNDSGYIVENYFSSSNDLTIHDSTGAVLTEGLINSFMTSSPEYAQNSSINDESPVGAVEEMKGEATVTRADGSKENITLGSPIYEGDVIQTSADGAVNIMFIDETSMAISESARIAIDNYEFDDATESGETDISVLRGVFVYTSGLIGRDDPDDVEIQTPVGSIGIRGTIIAGNINPEGQSEISVLEGAIVIKNGSGEKTLSQQYETVKLSGFQDNIEYVGVETANEIGKTYGSVSDVLPQLFSSINDSVQEDVKSQGAVEEKPETEAEVQATEESSDDVEQNEQPIEDQQDVTPEETLEIIDDSQEFQTKENVIDNKIDSQSSEKRVNNKSVNKIQESNFAKEVLFQEQTEFNDEPKVVYNFKSVFEGTDAGEVIGVIRLENYPSSATVLFAHSGGTHGTSQNGEYTINQIAGTNTYQIVLNNAVGLTPGSQIELANLVIEKTAVAGTNVTDLFSIDPTIQDGAVHVNSAGGYNYQKGVGTTPLYDNEIFVNDFDGNNDPNADYAFLDGSGHIVVKDSPSSGVLYTSSNGGFNSIANVGDLDNDGYSDIVAGDASASTNTGNIGIILGNPSPASAVLNNGPFTPNAGDGLGHDVAAAGDFNGDGYSDYVVSAPNATGSNGQVIVQYGNSANKVTITGGSGMRLGESVTGIGDYNGDGISDIIATTATNEAYIIFGEDTGDRNLTAGPGLSPFGFKITGLGGNTLLGADAAGDINGDGYDDFAISIDSGADVNTYVVYGKGTTATDYSLADLEDPDNALKIHNTGAGTSDPSSYQVTALGDQNGDGFADIQVGLDGGQQYIVFGESGGRIGVVTDGSPDDASSGVDGVVAATANDQPLVGNKNFYDNTMSNISMIGGSGNNIFEITNNQFRNIDGGKGFDTIKFMGNGGSIDFSNQNFENISQIEAIKFGGTGQSITLSVENIFNILKSSDNGELRINGNGTFNINATTPGTDVTTALKDLSTNSEASFFMGGSTIQLDDGNNYWGYEIGGYNLYIDQNLTTGVI